MLKKYWFATAALVLSTTVFAADGGGYLGLAAGMSDHSNNGNLANKTGFKLFGGYMFNKNFGLEGGYATTKSSDDNFELTADSFYAAAVANWPVTGAFDLYAKAGLGFNTFDHGGIYGDIGGGQPSTSETSAMFGIGTRYRFTPNFSVQAEYERYHSDTGLISAGLTISF
ncbi:outer membrane beta-barrel protein [Niveibacterium sp.]|uniref:outer membrane beta-barrel protein n=1 Tax=Niveibacterium sp. TaxID=2017444 RepID=UPI0035AFB48E